MAKSFRPWDVEQRWLLPPSVNELVPADHLAHFVRDTFRDQLDLSSVLDEYVEVPYGDGLLARQPGGERVDERRLRQRVGLGGGGDAEGARERVLVVHDVAPEEE